MLKEARQGTEQDGIEAANLVEGLDAPPGRRLLADGIAEQHAAQAKAPGMAGLGLRLLGQLQAGALGGVQAPSDVGTPHPAVQAWQFVLRDAEAPPQGRHLQQVEQVAYRQA